jgi:hypothetical protein
MRTPWTLSTIEAAIFLGLVLVLAGAATWASASASKRFGHLGPPGTGPFPSPLNQWPLL